MTTATIPSALVILVYDKAYMTVKDWVDPEGNAITPGGIDHLANYFGSAGDAGHFRSAVSSSTGLNLNSIVGTMIRPEENPIDLPRYPSLCTFRLDNSEDHFAARWFVPLGYARGQKFSVFALKDGSSKLIELFQDALSAYRKWRAGDIEDNELITMKIPYRAFLEADLTPVYSSVTLTKTVVGANSAGNADGGGDGFS